MSLLHQTPQFSVAEAQSIALSLFGIDASEVQVLPSDRDQNFLLQQYESNRFVLKISNAGENVEFIKAQSALLRHVEGNRMDCPKLVSSRNQNDIEFVEREGQRFPIRLVTYLEGRTLASVKFHPLELMQDLGRNIGGLTKSLKGFEHPALKREFQWDLQQAANVVQRKLHFVENEDLKQQIEQLAQRFGSYTKPLLGDLAHSVVQNDANDGNVLVEQVAAGEVCRRVTGLIDFGDAVYSWTIAELAIALAYTMLDKDDPLRVASEMIRGYVGEHEITESELAALFGLACMRLCASAVIAHEQHRIRPDDPYLMISQEPIRRTLPKLLKIPFEFATAAFRVAAGQPASSSHAGVVRWLKEQEDFPFPINPEQIGKRPQSAQLRVYDLGVSSPLLAPLGTSVSEPQLTKILFSDMDAAGISVGVGRYMEARLLYQSDQFSSGDACETSSSNSLAEERRTLHLGIDLFATAGAPVIAPLAGTIEIATVIDKALDYGGLLILRHQTEAGESFFTLYGHLAPASIADKSHGDHIEAGATIAELGEVHENGGWTPHLHFQLLLDLFGFEAFIPGVCEASRKSVWNQCSPDPNLILRIPTELFPPKEKSKRATSESRRRRIAGNLSLGYQDPIKMVRGWKHHLYDESGHKYLDAYNNVPHVGHCHPAVVEAVQRQMSLLSTNTRYLHDAIAELGDRIVATLPDELEVCYFLSSASEANELALRLARAHTGRKDVIVLEGAYHGHTTSLIDISPYKHDGPGGEGAPNWVHVAELADLYRGQYHDATTAGGLFAESVARICSDYSGRISAFIAESCPSVGGQIVFPPGYLSSVYEILRREGALCIADEVQTGYGRLGHSFYGFEEQEVSPDIVVLGKPIGNGYPLAAVIARRDIAESFDNGMEFFATFGGSTVSCAAGLAVLDVLANEALQENAHQTGEQLLDGFRKLQADYPIIGDVRGSGFFLGLELVRDSKSLEPAATEASFVVNRMREKGVLIGTDGPLNNVLKVRPPMTFDAQSAEQLLDALRRSLEELPR